MIEASSRNLTKSLFVEGMNCPGLLWYRVHAPDKLAKPGLFQQVTMSQGVEVGTLARVLYPDGILLYDRDGTKTSASLLTRKPLFEATFIHERLLCEADILLPNEDGTHTIIEVKSSTSIDTDELRDVAFQWYVLSKCGLRIRDAFICHVNSEYIKDGALEVEEFFLRTEVTDEIAPIIEKIEAETLRLISIMDGPAPSLIPGRHCKNENCPLDEVTYADLPEYNVTELYRQNGEKFVANGILKIADIKEGIGLNQKQLVQWRAVTTGQVQVDKKALADWLSEIEYPLAHLDFESLNPAIPRWDGTKPYQHVPFQYSMHIEYGDGRIEHREFLHSNTADPRPALVQQLKHDIQGVKKVLAHWASFERSRLQELAQSYPEEADWLLAIVTRLKDTIQPFQSFWYYHPKQHGSCSIKDVLPALVGKSYKDLAISNGTLAQVEYARYIDQPMKEEERSTLKKHLLEYCSLDTQGMVEILAVLKQAAE
jgi:hypothetical protein